MAASSREDRRDGIPQLSGENHQDKTSQSSRGNGRNGSSSSSNGKGKHPVCSFTPTEQKVMDALIDQHRHLKKDLVRDIGEGDWSDYNLQLHIHRMNRKMPAGHEIICEVDGRSHYYRYIIYPV